ncbi:MAG: hypothetical protein MJB14_04630, partial [Spirochaetes bacterium]|nr:hypothetical protein [Spirochaetota bacterium]
FSSLPISNKMDELEFPLNESVDLFSIIHNCTPVMEKFLTFNSYYHLLFQPIIRNQLVLKLYQHYQQQNSLKIWFPFAGMGAEPLLFSYLLQLIHEVDKPGLVIKNLSFLTSTQPENQLIDGLRINPFAKLLLKCKTDFAMENGFQSDHLKTSFKDAKKLIQTEKIDLLNHLEVPDKKINCILLNSRKLSDLSLFNKRIMKILNKLAEQKQDLLVILEVTSSFALEIQQLNLDPFKVTEIIDDILQTARTDQHLAYLFIPIQTKNHAKNNLSPISIKKLFEEKAQFTSKELKKLLLNSPQLSIKPAEQLHYAELLIISKLYKRALELIKKHYALNYHHAYLLLKKIHSECPNHKLAANAEKFIHENQLESKGFTAELLDAIVEEIDAYLEDENHSDVLKKAEWL